MPAWALRRYAATAASSTAPASDTAWSRCPPAEIPRPGGLSRRLPFLVWCAALAPAGEPGGSGCRRGKTRRNAAGRGVAEVPGRRPVFCRPGRADQPDQERQPAAQAAGPGISASGQRDQAVPEAGAVNDAAVAAYRLSAQAGNPLSERKLAQMFGRTSRRWARGRIAEARRVPSSGLTVDPVPLEYSVEGLTWGFQLRP